MCGEAEQTKKKKKWRAHLLVRHTPTQTVPRTLDTPANTILLALNRRRRARRVCAQSPGLLLVDKVSSTATANVVNRCLLAAQTLLLGKLLVEAEHGALRLLHVAGAAAASGVEGVGGRRGELDARGWAGGSSAGSDLGGLDAHGIASTATARVDVGGSYGWVGLGDVEGDHFDRDGGLVVGGVGVVGVDVDVIGGEWLV